MIESNGYVFSSESITCINLCEFCLWFCFPILIISSSYPHHPSLPGLEQARRTLWCLWQALDAGKVDAQDAPGSLEVPDLGFSRHFWNGHFRRLSFSCCERFDMFHERCEHDISWCPWKIYLNFKEKHDSFLDISWCPWNLQAIFFLPS